MDTFFSKLSYGIFIKEKVKIWKKKLKSGKKNCMLKFHINLNPISLDCLSLSSHDTAWRPTTSKKLLALPAAPWSPPPRTPLLPATALFTSTRSLSVSFQGESFSFQVSKAKPAPSPSVRKGTPERKKAGTTPARGAFAL